MQPCTEAIANQCECNPFAEVLILRLRTLRLATVFCLQIYKQFQTRILPTDNVRVYPGTSARCNLLLENGVRPSQQPQDKSPCGRPIRPTSPTPSGPSSSP